MKENDISVENQDVLVVPNQDQNLERSGLVFLISGVSMYVCMYVLFIYSHLYIERKRKKYLFVVSYSTIAYMCIQWYKLFQDEVYHHMVESVHK